MNKWSYIESLLISITLLMVSVAVNAQEDVVFLSEKATAETDTIINIKPTVQDSLLIQQLTTDTLAPKKHKRDWATWTPKPKVATYLAIFVPGAGQIYNRKFWKLPIVYGAFVGCAYAVRWNNMMYKDYKHGYYDLNDDDETTTYYNKLIHGEIELTTANQKRYSDLFKQRKDRYRRWRDISVFATVGVYLLQIVDAYVDASLSEFDISNDLSLSIEPTLMNNPTQPNPLKATALGVQCAINF